MNRSTLALLTTLLIAGAAPAQMLLATDGTTDQVIAFNPYDGSLMSAALFAIPNTTQVAAIDVNGEIWITEQTGDRITRRDITGTVLGTIGPTFVGGGLDNIRGLAYVSGLVYVTNAGTANGAPGNAIVVFDSAGNFVQSFTTNTLATSPFSVLAFEGDILVSGFANNRDIYRFTLGGSPVGIFHDSASISPAHGLARASDGNVWCIGFTTVNACKLDKTTGAVLTTITMPTGSTPRGIYELGNGNIMWTTGTAVQIYDVTTQTTSTVFTGTCNHLSVYGAPYAAANAYGTGCDGLALTTNGMPRIGRTSFAMVLNSVPLVSPIGLFAFGTAAINPGIDLTLIGMPGCFAYQNLDIGLFSGSPVSGGTSTMPLPIPHSPLLSGTALAAQGLSLSLATPFGFASSNGVQLVLGY
jgi:streptogramin lyase